MISLRTVFLIVALVFFCFAGFGWAIAGWNLVPLGFAAWTAAWLVGGFTFGNRPKV